MAMNSNLSFFLERLAGVSTNVFALMPQNSTTAVANGQIRFSLPSNCILNFRGLKLMFTATCEGTGARLPPKTSSLINRYEVLIGGVSVAQGFDLYNVLVHAKASLLGSKCDAVLEHPEMVRAISYVNGANFSSTNIETYDTSNNDSTFGIVSFEGMLGSLEPGLFDTSLVGDITVVLHTAGNEVLSSVANDAFVSGGTDFGASSGASCKYTLENIRMNVEVIGLASAVYDELIQRRISELGYIEVPFKNYQSFVDSHTLSTRFSISCQSLDRIWVVQRTPNYQTQSGAIPIQGYKRQGVFTSTRSDGTDGFDLDIGKPQYDFGGVLGTNEEKYTTAFFNFKENVVSGGVSGATPKYQIQLNGSYMPQSAMNAMEMYAMSMNALDRYYHPQMTRDQYLTNYFVQCYRTCLPGSSTRTLSGIDTRSINLAATFQSQGLTPSTPLAIFCEMTSTMRVGANRAIEVIV